MGNGIVECPKCKRKWIVKLKNDIDYYCEHDETKCNIISGMFEDEEESE